jgi:quaternary ammonium compound-resistance protein SugE
MMNPWALLAIAGVMEAGWAVELKYSEGFTRLWPSVATVIGAWASFYLLSLAMKAIPVRTAYAVWVGIGSVGTAILAVFLFDEPVTALRLAGFGLILAGVAALKLA